MYSFDDGHRLQEISTNRCGTWLPEGAEKNVMAALLHSVLETTASRCRTVVAVTMSQVARGARDGSCSFGGRDRPSPRACPRASTTSKEGDYAERLPPGNDGRHAGVGPVQDCLCSIIEEKREIASNVHR